MESYIERKTRQKADNIFVCLRCFNVARKILCEKKIVRLPPKMCTHTHTHTQECTYMYVFVHVYVCVACQLQST